MSFGPDSRRIAAMLDSLPILPLRNSVLFPASVVPINVGRPRSVRLVRELLGKERAFVGVLSQKDAGVTEPTFEDLYRVGTIARVVKVIRLGPENYSVVLNGLGRMEVVEPLALEPYMRARATRLTEHRGTGVELDALGVTLRESTREVLTLMPNLPRETASILDQVKETGSLADLVAANFPPTQATVEKKQRVLEALDHKERVKLTLAIVAPQLELLRAKKQIASEVEEEITRSQREDMLREQMRSIKRELGEKDDDEIELLRGRIADARPPAEVADAAKKQLRRLRSMSPQSAEYNVGRNYVEWLADLPWTKTTEDELDVATVRRCLDEDHHGLEKVKARIVQFSAVRKLRKDLKGPILLFVGPPGVGKTSLGRSIARAMGRSYERIALGGVRDEAEIRGHRRTYVGALPGRIMRALKRAGTRNPVLVLDEIEKLGADVRGDPGAALLEVLDPEQNRTFRDHYIDLAFNLSEVLFIATANSLRGIQGPLLDRMEVIEVPGYTRGEKLAIAEEYLAPKQVSAHGLTSEQLDFTREGLEGIVDYYTREAGVRGLERQIASVCRAAAVRYVERLAKAEPASVEPASVKPASVKPATLEGPSGVGARAGFYLEVTPQLVEEVLGAPRYRAEDAEKKLRPGVATALAATPEGGLLLFVEASKMPGKGRIMLTGNMRNVMQESAYTAVSYVRSKAEKLHLKADWMKDIDLHLHVPHAGLPKDGASSGLALFAAVASLLLEHPLRAEVAMCGELSLRGTVLEVEDLKLRLLAAHRAGIREVLIPERNRRELDELPEQVTSRLTLRLVRTLDDVLPLVLEPPEEPSPEEPSGPPRDQDPDPEPFAASP